MAISADRALVKVALRSKFGDGEGETHQTPHKFHTAREIAAAHGHRTPAVHTRTVCLQLLSALATRISAQPRKPAAPGRSSRTPTCMCPSPHVWPNRQPQRVISSKNALATSNDNTEDTL